METQFGTNFLENLRSATCQSGKVFASQERVSSFPEKGLTSGEVRETSRQVRGTSGEVWETSGEPLDSCKVPVRELPGKSLKNFRGSLGNFL